MACAAAARLKRRAGLSPTHSKTPNARAMASDFKPSSSAARASASRAVSTINSREGSRPSAMRPCQEGWPSSRAKARGQHHKRSDRRPPAALSSTRRAARRSAKPRLAIQSPAEAPAARETGFTSCTQSVSRLRANRGEVSSSPSRQPSLEDEAAAARSGRSIFSMDWRSLSMSAARGCSPSPCPPPPSWGRPANPPPPSSRSDAPHRRGEGLGVGGIPERAVGGL